jgi:hypothetical protein
VVAVEGRWRGRIRGRVEVGARVRCVLHSGRGLLGRQLDKWVGSGN